MKVNDIINELLDYCFNDHNTIEEDKDLFNNYQIEYLDGFIGIIMNQYKNIDGFEVYLNIKSTDKIACPLLYKQFKNVIEAKNYFDELKNLIDNNTEEYVANRCKIGV